MSKCMNAFISLFVLTILLSGCSNDSFMRLSDVESALPASDKPLHINVHGDWQLAPARVGGVYTPANHIELTPESVIFQVNQMARRVSWELPLGRAIDIQQYPILSVTYRATSPARFDAWGMYGQNPASSNYKHGLYIFNATDFVADNRKHTITRDLRTLRDDAFLDMLVIAYRNNDISPAEFEIYEIKLSQDTDASDGQVSYNIPEYLDAEVIKLRVTDQQGQPVSQAEVIVDGAIKEFKRSSYTDVDGIAELKTVSGHATTNPISIKAMGFMPVTIADASKLLADVGGADCGCAAPTVKLVRSDLSNIKIVDQFEKPIKQASIHLRVNYDELPDLPYVLPNDLHYMTNRKGECYQPIPSEFVKSVEVFVYHDSYDTPETIHHANRNDTADVYWHVRGTYERIAKISGSKITKEREYQFNSLPYIYGTVYDAAGKPLPDTLVTMNSGRRDLYPRTYTNARGEYKILRVGTAKKNQQVVNFIHPDAALMAIDLTDMSMTEISGAPQNVQLPDPTPYTGYVTDAQGNPIDNAVITVMQWAQSAENKLTVNEIECTTCGGDTTNSKTIGYIDKKYFTNEQGAFTITNADADALYTATVKAASYEALPATINTKSPSETFVLKSKSFVKATVIDAVTGKAIENFNVSHGISWGDNQNPDWQLGTWMLDIKTKKNTFTVSFNEKYPRQFLRVDAAGYKPVISRSIDGNEGRVNLQFALEPATQIAGHVKDRDGKPVQNAYVIPVALGNHAQIEHPTEINNSSRVTIKTKADGSFKVDDPGKPFAIFVSHEKGMAVLPVEGTTSAAIEQIMLKPWAKVTGKVDLGKELEGKHFVSLNMDTSYSYYDPETHQGIHLNFGSINDVSTDGSFSFEYAPVGAGFAQVYYVAADSSISPLFKSPITVNEGTNDLTVKPSNLKLVGKIKYPDLDKILEDDGHYININLYPKHRKPNSQRYDATPNADGTFEMINLQPGRYALSVQVYERDGDSSSLDLASEHKQDVTVEKDGGTLDLGEIVLEGVKRLNTGDKAPAFEVPNLNNLDEMIKLSDFRGKYVLIDFWATWCGPCVGETPNIKAAYDKYKDTGKFTVLALSLDRDAQEPLDYAKKNELTYPQGFLGDWAADTVTDKYNVRGIPAIFLVDPEGNIVAKNLRGKRIDETIEKYLGKQ